LRKGFDRAWAISWKVGSCWVLIGLPGSGVLKGIGGSRVVIATVLGWCCRLNSLEASISSHRSRTVVISGLLVFGI